VGAPPVMYPSVRFPLVLLACCAAVGVSASHMLGVFVNVHRSQLLVHLAVARVLLQRGHHLTLVTTQPLEQHWLSENLTHILVPWKLPAAPLEDQLHDNFVTRLQWTLARLEQSGELLSQPAWRNFMQAKHGEHYDLMLLGYHFNDHLLGVAAHFQCPVAIITTQQPIGFVHSLLGNPEERWYVPQPYDSRQRTGLAGVVFGLLEKCSELLARQVMQRIYSTHFPTPRYPSFEAMRRRVVLALNNHHMISEGPIGALLPSMLDIGGIVLEQSMPVGNLSDLELSAKRPVILFSLGTRFSWRKAPAQLELSFVQAFAQLTDYDIYWTYDGDNASAISLSYTNIRLAKWWPQPQLLAQPQVRLFISHGGKGSLSEALYHGVPMLGLPLVGDQRVNLRKMQQKGWGLTLHMQNISQEAILCAIRNILNDDLYGNNIRRDSLLYRDRPLNASELTAYWLEYVIRHKGAKHLYSPARELSFWQQYLLDLRLLIYGSLGLLSWALIRLDRALS
ncbi:hypothetical protein KR222_004164, partial [Zaprionus bogoriensis]